MARDLALAVQQISATIARQLTLVPAGCTPVQLPPPLLRSVAATIAQALDEYGHGDGRPLPSCWGDCGAANASGVHSPDDIGCDQCDEREDEPEDERARLERECGESEWPWERHP